MLEMKPIDKNNIPDGRRAKKKEDKVRDFIIEFVDSEYDAIEVIAKGYKNFNSLKHAMIRGCKGVDPSVKVRCRIPRIFLVKE